MRDFYRNINSEFKTVLWSTFVIAVLVILLIPCLFFSLMEIPQGIALGGSIAIIIYAILAIIDNPNNPKKSMTFTIVTMFIRFVVITGILILVGWLYYQVGFKAFNLFAVAGGYFIPLVISMILQIKEKSVGNS